VVWTRFSFYSNQKWGREGGDLRGSVVLVLFFNEIFFSPVCCSFSYSDALDLEVSLGCAVRFGSVLTADSRLRFCCCCFVPSSICACFGFYTRLESGLRPRWSGSASQFRLVHGAHFRFEVGFLQLFSWLRIVCWQLFHSWFSSRSRAQRQSKLSLSSRHGLFCCSSAPLSWATPSTWSVSPSESGLSSWPWLLTGSCSLTVVA
jgi:hypothetical protein